MTPWARRPGGPVPGGDGVGGLHARGGEHAVALGVRDHRQDRQGRAGGGLFGGPGREVVHLVQRVLARRRAPLGEPGDHEVVGVVVLGVAVPHLVEEAHDVLLAAEGALQDEQREPGRRVVGGPGGRLAALGAHPVRTRLAAQRLVHGGEDEQQPGVVALGLDEPPVAGPRGGGGFLAEHVEAVPPAVPVVAGGGEQLADLGPAALGQRRPGRDECGVVERGVEGLRRRLLAGAAQRGWRWGHRGTSSRRGSRTDDHTQQTGRRPSASRAAYPSFFTNSFQSTWTSHFAPRRAFGARAWSRPGRPTCRVSPPARQPTCLAAARPAVRPENRQPPRKVPSSER